jgi:hypothetical protein
LITTIEADLGVADSLCLLVFWHRIPTDCVHRLVAVKALVLGATIGELRHLAAITATAYNVGRHGQSSRKSVILSAFLPRFSAIHVDTLQIGLLIEQFNL